MNKIKEWLSQTEYKNHTVEVASADASFRKYYRLKNGSDSVLLMDSSLEKYSLKPFLDITTRLLNANINAPKILLENLEDGFLIIEDFGNIHYLNILTQANYKTLYSNAINSIVNMQNADTTNLPLYDEKFLHVEMNLMREWYLEKLLGAKLTASQAELVATTLKVISAVVLEQPQDIFVHRDFHSRNIMLYDERKIGVIDYQDAMNGAITYDLVSLLKDCYISFDENEIRKLALEFRDKKGLSVDDDTFIKWFDFMGLQRHIKVLGVFSRLSIRDTKDGYLKDIPLTLKYVLDAANKYSETKELAMLLRELTDHN